MKKCRLCKKKKSLKDFHVNSNRKDGKDYRCKQCIVYIKKFYRKINKDLINKKQNIKYKKYKKIIRAKIRKDRKINPDKYKNEDLKSSFGIDIKMYKLMLKFQGNKCAICRKKETLIRNSKKVALSVDHNHTNGKVRCLLCHKCNYTLGLVNENIDILQRMINYLKLFDMKGFKAKTDVLCSIEVFKKLLTIGKV